MNITSDRLNHSISVGRLMMEIVISSSNYKISCEEALVLGMLHDIGYEFSKTQQEHSKLGGEILRKQGYKFWKEVYYHGTPQSEYSSLELDLLNYADLVTSPTGARWTIEERILDVEKRYGSDSIQLKQIKELVNMQGIK